KKPISKRDLVFTTATFRSSPLVSTRVFPAHLPENRHFSAPVEKVGLARKACEEILCRLQMGHIKHLAIERNDTRIVCRCKRIDDKARPRNRLGRWRERGIDDRHLVGMDAHLCGEPVASRLAA